VSPRIDLNLDLDARISTAMAQAYSVSAQNYSRAFDNLDYAFDNLNYSMSTLNGLGAIGGWGEQRPVAWAQSDPADSLYRQARDQFNRGDYRKAAELFKSLPQKFTNSVYIADAQYWQAFALYRIGGTPELQEGLAVLEARKPAANEGQGGTRRPASANGGSGSGSGVSMGTSGNRTVTNSSDVDRVGISTYAGAARGQTDAAGLAARIANVLSTRGMTNDAAVKRALAAGGNTCDQDDQSVKAEALSALMQNDPETGRQMAVKILANKDECSVPLRRNAVMLVGNKHDDAAAATLIPVAKSDPSSNVRMAALDYLIRIQTDAAVTAVIDIARSSDDKQIQRAAVRALAQSINARARAEVRTIVENNGGDEQLRTSVIDGLDRDRMTADDAAWLRSLFAKTTSMRIKERIVSALARAGGDANNQWLLALVRNDDESLEARTAALEHVGRTMDLATLDKMYDASSQRPIREAVMNLLAERKEPEALDKIAEIAKSGTDVDMRRHAISILSRSKDPRASKLLLQLVDH
jgi:HEAT repeat protein